MTKQGSICGYQISFSKLWEGYNDNKEALQACNALAKRLRNVGIVCFCSTLPNQLKSMTDSGSITEESVMSTR